MRPVDVDNEEAAPRAWYNLFYRSDAAGGRAKRALHVDQQVRITRWKGDFDEDYLPNWSREHFVVRKRLKHPRLVYKIVDASGEHIEGPYGAELQPIVRNRLEVERVIQRRGRGAQREVLVKWRGWPDKFNRWIPQRSLAKYSTPPRQTVDEDENDILELPRDE
jgi:hypothetical protein